jgi:hypothetical protein
MPTLPEIKSAIQQLIPDGVDLPLQRLEAVLLPGTPKYNEYLIIKSRYSAYLSSIIRGDMPLKDQNTTYNGITYSLLLFIESLTESDLKAGDLQATPGQAPAKQGELLYSIPHEMEPGREYRCVVRLAYLKEVIRRNWEAHAGDVHQSIRVAEVMSVELINFDETPHFSIRTLSDAVQFLDQDDYTEWLFFVKPIHPGEYSLVLRVAVLEVRNGREVRKEVVIEEHILVSTTAPEPVDQFAKTNVSISLGAPASVSPGPPPFSKSPESPSPKEAVMPNQPEPEAHEEGDEAGPSEQEPIIATTGHRRGLVVTAFFLAFILFGSTATWAFTPPETKDWVWARYVKNDEKTYSDFILKYPASVRRETAFYRKAKVAPSVQNLRAYKETFPAGSFREEVVQRLQGIEQDQILEIHRNPVSKNVRQFLNDFPESDHLADIKQVVESKPELRKELLPELERTYLETIQRRPNALRIRAFLKDFPESEKLPEIKKIVDGRPELQKEARPALEKAYLDAVRRKPEPPRVRAFLRDFPTSDSLMELKHVVGSKPELKRAVWHDLQEAEIRQKRKGRPQ